MAKAADQLVLDASLAVAWYLKDEEHSGLARQVLPGERCDEDSGVLGPYLSGHTQREGQQFIAADHGLLPV